MNDAEYEALKTKIDAMVDQWIGYLGLHHWTIACSYEREGIHEVDGQPTKNTAATCAPSWIYAQAALRFSMPKCANLDDDELLETIVHELMHIMVCETRASNTDASDWLNHEERTCTLLARAFIRMRPKPEVQTAE